MSFCLERSGSFELIDYPAPSSSNSSNSSFDEVSPEDNDAPDHPLSFNSDAGDESHDDEPLRVFQDRAGDVGGSSVAPSELPVLARLAIGGDDQTEDQTDDQTEERRQNSTPIRLRPRSNPRTRTPLRYESPLALTPGSTTVAGSRSLSSGRLRADSILEDARDEQARRDEGGQADARRRVAPGHWLSRAAQDPVQRPRQQLSPRPRLLSDKQRPSRRKMRRWDNDRFVGMASLLANSPTSAHAFWMAEMEQEDYYLPNHPTHYRSEFAKLATDDSARGLQLRDRFVRGMVANANKDMHQNTGQKSNEQQRIKRKILSRFKSLSIPLNALSSTCKTATNHPTSKDGKTSLGEHLVRRVPSRIYSVVARSCAVRPLLDVDQDPPEKTAHPNTAEKGTKHTTATLNDLVINLVHEQDEDSPPPSASEVVNAFESLLISCTPTSFHVDTTSQLTEQEQYEQEQQRQQQQKKQQWKTSWDILKHVLDCPPRVSDNNVTCIQNDIWQGTMIPTIQFHFRNQDSNNQPKKSPQHQQGHSNSFYRILLYAVCSFHGLEASSCNRKAKNDQHGKNVIVQSGVCLGPTLKFLDYVSLDD